MICLSLIFLAPLVVYTKKKNHGCIWHSPGGRDYDFSEMDKKGGWRVRDE